MAARSEVRLVVSDRDFFDAKEWSIESDMMQSADAFSITVPNPNGTATERLSVYDPVRVLVDETVQMTGWIDELNARGDASSGATIEVIGRDRFGQLVDCSAWPRTYSGRDLLQIAKDISSPWVTSWIVDNEENRLRLATAKRAYRRVKRNSAMWDRYMGSASELTKVAFNSNTSWRSIDAKRLAKAKANMTKIRALVYPRIKVSPGESIMEVLERAADKIGMMVWQAADGTGIIARPNYDQPPLYKIQLHPPTLDTASANNVKSWDIKRNGTERFEAYYLTGSSGNTSGAYGATSHHSLTDTDELAGLSRRRIVGSSGSNRAQAKNQLTRDVQLRKFNAEALTYTVQGHAQDGRLWQVDSLVAVDDRVNGIDGDWYLTRRRFVCGRDSGQTTELTLHPKGVLLA